MHNLHLKMQSKALANVSFTLPETYALKSYENKDIKREYW